jgi:hypothetical protein
MIVTPTRDTTFEEWAASLRLLRPDIEIQPMNPSENGWKEWGNQVAQSQSCQKYSVPRTDGFETWQKWVFAFIQAFGTNA